ncbi:MULTISPECIES: N-acetyltransferase [Filomicrobium]|uniref:Predicted N-acetyltransferase YhbS n=1 Tax=Filomicrobium insigne TaxID=418854 RepID=A0A1H0LLG9_9HYPH|nr:MULTISPECIES: N-acetyltransferase [Filomicrobium]MCV0368670.1 N-acetyltransferase [Filomicrobium sp.]SDO69069.1 Predicted N-acetyltransferase YhbS [Filomicrobium insigne]
MNNQLKVEAAPVITRPAELSDLPEISRLHARAFGPGRFARTAYRVREGRTPVSPYCRVAVANGAIIAALRFTEISIGGTTRALLLGPLAVDPAFANRGYGRQLIAEGLDLARANDIALVILVGDEPYYARFGFKPLPPGSITFPGPVNPARILGLELQTGAAASFHGLIQAA